MCILSRPQDKIELLLSEVKKDEANIENYFKLIQLYFDRQEFEKGFELCKIVQGKIIDIDIGMKAYLLMSMGYGYYCKAVDMQVENREKILEQAFQFLSEAMKIYSSIRIDCFSEENYYDKCRNYFYLIKCKEELGMSIEKDVQENLEEFFSLEKKYTEWFSEIYIFIAELYCLIEKYEEAIKFIEKAISIEKRGTEKVSFYKRLGYIYWINKYPEKSIVCYKKAIELADKRDVRRYSIYYQWGLVYYFQQNWRNAIPYFKKAFELAERHNINPRNKIYLDILFYYGLSLYGVEKFFRALKYLKGFLQYIDSEHQNYSMANFYLGNVYWYRREYEMAKKHYTLVVECESSLERDKTMAIQYLKKIEERDSRQNKRISGI